MHALESHIKTLQGDNEALMQRLTTAEAQTEVERARTEKAIAAFAALAERLDALAEERRRPWWRRAWSDRGHDWQSRDHAGPTAVRGAVTL